MSIEKILNTLIYLGLLGATIAIVKQTIWEYTQGSTTFTDDRQPLTHDDVPTLTICLSFEEQTEGKQIYSYPNNISLYPVKYGKDFSIQVEVSEKEYRTATLSEKRYVNTVSGLSLHLSELRVRRQKVQCYKISPKWQKQETLDFEQFWMKFTLSFPSANETSMNVKCFYDPNRPRKQCHTGTRLDGEN